MSKADESRAPAKAPQIPKEIKKIIDRYVCQRDTLAAGEDAARDKKALNKFIRDLMKPEAE